MDKNLGVLLGGMTSSEGCPSIFPDMPRLCAWTGFPRYVIQVTIFIVTLYLVLLFRFSTRYWGTRW